MTAIIHFVSLHWIQYFYRLKLIKKIQDKLRSLKCIQLQIMVVAAKMNIAGKCSADNMKMLNEFTDQSSILTDVVSNIVKQESVSHHSTTKYLRTQLKGKSKDIIKLEQKIASLEGEKNKIKDELNTSKASLKSLGVCDED